MTSGIESDAKPDVSDEAKDKPSDGADEARVEPMELDLESEAGRGRDSDAARSEEASVRVNEESEVVNADKPPPTESKGFIQSSGGGLLIYDGDVDEVFDISKVVLVDDQDESFEARNDDVDENVDLLSEFDSYVANEKDGMALGASRALKYGFELGDMVWGKVKSHPWWPGHIFSEEFATSQVRRTRREGHVLVAFFGDSSYGWFDPAELIPFEPHYAEKSRQTNYRNFGRAVEEAVDELSRRCGVALVCKCRNPHNFRDTNVGGYYVVDVPDYEHGAVYSEDQIRKARDGFSPKETVSLLKQMASLPFRVDQKSLDFIKNKAVLSAYRKAVFEEYDETYAEAFGAPGRPAKGAAAVSNQPIKPRAPLSGPLVIAEALGGRKSGTKPMKVKDHSKKDKYLFKRRDETSNVKPHLTTQGQDSSSTASAYLEGSIALGDGDFLLQKRSPSVSVKPQVSAKQEQTEVGSEVAPGPKLSLKLSLDKESGALQEVKEELTESVTVGEGTKHCIKDGISQSLKQEEVVKNEQSAKQSGSYEGYELKNQVRNDHSVGDPSSISVKSSAKSSAGKNAVGGVKKAKFLKRPAGDMNPENTLGDKKKKKKRKLLGTETSFRDPQRVLTSGKVSSTLGKVAGKLNRAGLVPKEGVQVEHHKKDVTSSSDVSESVGTLPNVELELPQLVSNLQALALDPFHGAETNNPAIVRKFFLQFRALVYQKSLALSPPSETELLEGGTSETLSGGKALEVSHLEPVRDSSSSKAVKPSFRSDDRTVSGRKRAPSDRQGEIAAKRSKKMSDMKSLAAEKKASLKGGLDAQRGEVKETATPVPRKSLKQGLVKKLEPPARTVLPTMLVMKFPPKISLPSPAELKAKFARFGPMDQSGLRVFYKSSTCRVVFLYKSDAYAAYKSAASNNSFFGNVTVRCSLREADGAEVPASGKGKGDDSSNEIPRAKDSSFTPSSALRQRQQLSLSNSALQLKSILKKSSGDEAGGAQVTGGSGNSKGTARVKFMLGGEEEPSRNEQSMIAGNRNNKFNNSASFADDGAPSSSSSSSSPSPTSIAMMNFNSRNFQKPIPPASSLPPILPLPPGIRAPPPQYAKPPPPPPHNNFSSQQSDMALPPPPPLPLPSRNSYNILNTPPTYPSSPTVDISQQMLNLLTRCNDVVTNVQGILGYVPYHPL